MLQGRYAVPDSVLAHPVRPAYVARAKLPFAAIGRPSLAGPEWGNHRTGENACIVAVFFQSRAHRRRGNSTGHVGIFHVSGAAVTRASSALSRRRSISICGGGRPLGQNGPQPAPPATRGFMGL